MPFRLPEDATLGQALKRRTLEWLLNMRLRFPFRANTIRVIDGDTIVVRPTGWAGRRIKSPIRIRLAGVDAPELEQAGYLFARDGLIRHLDTDVLFIVPTKFDIYGRVVAHVRSKKGWACFYLAKTGKAYPETLLTRIFAVPSKLMNKGVHGPFKGEHPRAWRNNMGEE